MVFKEHASLLNTYVGSNFLLSPSLGAEGGDAGVSNEEAVPRSGYVHGD